MWRGKPSASEAGELDPPRGDSPQLDGGVHFYWRDFTELIVRGSGVCIDIGCGAGTSRPMIESLGYRYVGLDIRATEGTLLVGDAHALPLASACADLVVSRQVFEHLRHPQLAASEIRRILKAGGVFCGSTSLLEPFHDSYFNFTHWGLQQLLRDEAGFSSVRIAAGPNVTLFIVYYFFDMLGLLCVARRLAPPIAVVVFGPAFLVLKFLHLVKASAKFILQPGSPPRASELWKLHSISWAGYLLFHARNGYSGESVET